MVTVDGDDFVMGEGLSWIVPTARAALGLDLVRDLVEDLAATELVEFVLLAAPARTVNESVTIAAKVTNEIGTTGVASATDRSRDESIAREERGRRCGRRVKDGGCAGETVDEAMREPVTPEALLRSRRRPPVR